MVFALHILILSAHLLAMNVGAGGPITLMFLEWKASRGSSLWRGAANYLASATIAGLLSGSLLGAVLVALLYSPEFAQLWTTRLRHKAEMATLELLISLAIMVVYRYWAAPGAISRWAFLSRMGLLLFAGTNLLYHFPVLFLIGSTLRDEAAISGEPIKGALFREQLARGEIASVAVHVVLACLAVSGMMVLGYALRVMKQAGEDETARREGEGLAVAGAWLSLGPTLLQLPTGLWSLSVMGTGLQSQLMGSDPIATTLFLLSLGAAFWLMRQLAAIALGDVTRRDMIRAMILMVATVVLMTGMHHAGREAARKKRNPPPQAAQLTDRLPSRS